MRVTNNMFPDNLVNQLSLLNERQLRLQRQAASGQRVQLPEDDPSAMRRVLGLEAENRVQRQYQSNIARLRERATASFDAIKALTKISNRISEIATLADGTRPQDQLNVYAAEVTQLIQQAAQVLNTTHRGAYLFSGTFNDRKPFDVTTNPAGQVAGVTYQGNASVPEAEISRGVTLTAQVVGANTGGAGPLGLITDSRTGADFFNHMIALQDHLLAGDVAGIANTVRAQVDADEDHLIQAAAANAAIQARLEAAAAIASSRSASLDELVSKEADVDLADALVRLTEVQNAYRVALQSGGTILRQSLLDYLR
jgi:flagellar hook-associated protein 3 FlgL